MAKVTRPVEEEPAVQANQLVPGEVDQEVPAEAVV
jgi:hypothetical protein